MQSCPATIALIDLLQGRADVRVRLTAEVCETCREDLRLLRDLKFALLGRDLHVPREFSELALAGIRAAASNERNGRRVEGTHAPGAQSITEDT